MSVIYQDDGVVNDQTAPTLVRPVDALERLFYRYSERNPLHFMMVAEFDVVLDERDLTSALEMVRQRHALLSVHVEDRPGTHLGFYRADDTAPVPLRVIVNDNWPAVATEELIHPFDRSTAPLMRAVLLVDTARSTLVLTIDHTIADGISTVMILNDLLAALNGDALQALPVPPSQEALLAKMFGAVSQWASPSQGEPDPRMLTPAAVRKFDGTPTNLHHLSMSADETARLVDRCRRERTTVHSAIVTAASHVRSRLRGEDYVRVLNPMNIRSVMDAGGDCAPYFSCAVTGMAPLGGAAFWDQSRALTAELTVARAAPGVLASSLATQQAIGVGAGSATAEDLFTKALPVELLISNLGVQDLEAAGPIRPTALWAPVLETQIAGGVVIGVTTYQSVLRMVACGYEPTKPFIETVARTLVEMSA